MILSGRVNILFSNGIFMMAGLKQYEQAETYLSHAKWAILKADHCENAVRSQLHRNFGLLYASQGSYDKALYQLAMDVRL